MRRELLVLIRINQLFIERQREISAAIVGTFLGVTFWDFDGARPLSISELATELGLPNTTVSRHLGYLGAGWREEKEGLGLVYTEAHPEDGRAKTIHLTQAGRDLRDRILKLL